LYEESIDPGIAHLFTVFNWVGTKGGKESGTGKA
jgi:hypothetical protein